MSKTKKEQKEAEEVVDQEKVEDQTTEEQEENKSEEQEVNEAPVDSSPENELAEFKNKYLRLYSEFENFRKRTAKEKLDFMKTANQDLILDLLPVIDDFERAQQSFDAENADSFKEGIDLIFSKLLKVLEKSDVKPIEAKGETFDTELHEAITQIPAPSDDMKGKVVDEVEKGYLLGEKVIRYSKVVIGS